MIKEALRQLNDIYDAMFESKSYPEKLPPLNRACYYIISVKKYC